jgi:hypothetical protein
VLAAQRHEPRARARVWGGAYRENPVRETLRAVEGLAGDPAFARRFGEFQRLMVYGARVEYAMCIGTLRDLAGRLR